MVAQSELDLCLASTNRIALVRIDESFIAYRAIMPHLVFMHGLSFDHCHPHKLPDALVNSLTSARSPGYSVASLSLVLGS